MARSAKSMEIAEMLNRTPRLKKKREIFLVTFYHFSVLSVCVCLSVRRRHLVIIIVNDDSMTYMTRGQHTSQPGWRCKLRAHACYFLPPAPEAAVFAPTKCVGT